MTLTQLGAFVLVARLGSVRAAADVLWVRGPAVPKSIASRRLHPGDQLVADERLVTVPVAGRSGTDPDSGLGRVLRSHRFLTGGSASFPTTYMLNFLATPDAMQIMCSTGVGAPPSRFRPPVYVTIWS